MRLLSGPYLVLHCIVLYCTGLYCILFYCIVLYCIVLYLSIYIALLALHTNQNVIESAAGRRSLSVGYSKLASKVLSLWSLIA